MTTWGADSEEVDAIRNLQGAEIGVFREFRQIGGVSKQSALCVVGSVLTANQRW